MIYDLYFQLNLLTVDVIAKFRMKLKIKKQFQ